MKRNLLVIVGGGPTQVLNATLAWIVEEARARDGFGRVLGACRGIRGLKSGEVASLDRLTGRDLELLRKTPGMALGSSRFRPSEDDLACIGEHLRRLDVGAVIFIGGNGTMHGAAVVSEFCRGAGIEVQVIGVPKTVDNDIANTDRCPGYASAARTIAQFTRELGVDVRSLPQPISILETMGRDTGWLAAASAGGKREPEDAPHMVLLPEVPFAMEPFLDGVNELVSRQGWAVIAVAEGICGEGGRPVWRAEQPGQADELGRPLTSGVSAYLAETVSQRLKLRCRSERPGLLGRASMLHVAEQDLRDAELAGRAAVRALLDGEKDKMISLLPLDAPGDAGYRLVPLSEVGSGERKIPAEWITPGPIPVNDCFFRYLRPLVGELPPFHPFLSPDGAA